MKIASCILFLTFAVYIDFIGCLSSMPGPPNFGSFKWVQWVNVETHGQQVRVRKNLLSGKVLAIELPGQLPFRAIPGEIKRVIDDAKNLHFAAQVNPKTGKWIAVGVMKPAYNLILPPLPPIKPRDIPETNGDS